MPKRIFNSDTADIYKRPCGTFQVFNNLTNSCVLKTTDFLKAQTFAFKLQGLQRDALSIWEEKEVAENK